MTKIRQDVVLSEDTNPQSTAIAPNIREKYPQKTYHTVGQKKEAVIQ